MLRKYQIKIKRNKEMRKTKHHDVIPQEEQVSNPKGKHYLISTLNSSFESNWKI